MKKAPNLRLSLRKLLVATMAVGPLAVLPSPLWAVLPTYVVGGTTNSFSIANGTASVATSSNVANISTSDRAVLVWGTDGTTALTGAASNFNIASGETYNFILPSGGAVLNRVTKGSGSGNAATIAGTLFSNGKVFVLSDSGNIVVAGGATISTQGGLVLSTLNEGSSGAFTSFGDLSYTGTSNGDISIGSTASVGGNLTAIGGAISFAAPSVAGDVVLRSVTSASGVAFGTSSISGNLSVTTNNGAITQTGAIAVGTSNGTQTTTLNSGTAAITLGNLGNDFKVVTANTTGTAGAVTLGDANIITLGASTIGGSLTVETIGKVNTTAIQNNGTLTIGGDATFTATASNNSAINIGSNSTIAGTVAANTAGGAITINTLGDLKTGAIASNVTTGLGAAASGLSSALLGSAGSLSAITVTSGGAGYITAPQVVISAPPAGGTQATATATINETTGLVTAINITNAGSGYTTVPTVTLTSGGETTTAVLSTPTLLTGVASATITTPSAAGTYAAAPSVTFTAAPTGGVTATGTAIFDSATGIVSGINITNPGSGYLAAPTVTVTAPTSSVIGRAISVTTAGNLTVNGAVVTSNNSTTPGITLTAANVTFNTGSVSNTGPVTINATAGNATLGAITANQVTVRSTGGNITQVAGTVLTTSNTTGTSLFNAGTGNITLTEVNALANNQIIQLTGANADVRTINNLTIGTSNVTGNVSLLAAGNPTAGNRGITLGSGTGTGVGQNIVIGGNLTATASGTGQINDNNYSALNVAGTLTLTSGSGNITLDAANALGALSPTAQFGQINASTTGDVYVVETGTLNLGTITANNVVGISNTGDIIDSGVLTITNLGYFALPAGNLTLGNTTSSIGRISVQGGANHSIVSNTTLTLHTTTNTTGNLSLTTGNGAGIVLTGGSVAGNLTVNSNGTVSVTTGTTTVARNLDVTAAGTITDTAPGALVVAGNATLSSATSIELDGANDFSTVVINNSTGQTTIRDINALTISGNTTGQLNAASGSGSVLANAWNLVLGNINSNSLIVASGNGGGGVSGSITQQAGTAIHSETLSRFTAQDANIVIANNGNSFGRVELFVNGTSASRTVTLVEDSTLKLGNLSSRGTTTLTSRFGSIIEDTTDDVVITSNGTLATNAASGSILLGNTTHTLGTTTGNVTAFTANASGGAVAMITNNQVSLGNVTAQSLTVTATNNVTQSGRLNIFGTTSVTAGRNITLSNTTNNFGRVFLTTSNVTDGNINIVEGGTLNLGGVTMAAGATANFTATSVNGDIIDSGLGGVRPGGTIATPGFGAVAFNAANGNITLDDPTTDFATTSGVSFTGGNVTFAVLGQSPLLLGAAGVTSTAGNLTVTSATGNIGNIGNLTVTGDASFQTGNGNITVTQPDNRFGAVRFNAAGIAGAGQVRINQANDINIITGSSATGVAEFVSGGAITIVNRGGTVSLGSTGNFTATGSIVLPKLIQAVGTLTVFSPSLKDLSALSQAADLAGKAPVNLGSGTYVAPAQ